MKSLLIVIVFLGGAVGGTCQEVLDGTIAVIGETAVRYPKKTPYDDVATTREAYLKAYAEGYRHAMKGGNDDSKLGPKDPARRLLGFVAGYDAAVANGHKGITNLDKAKTAPKTQQ